MDNFLSQHKTYFTGSSIFDKHKYVLETYQKRQENVPNIQPDDRIIAELVLLVWGAFVKLLHS